MSEGFGAGDREPAEEQWWPGPTPVEVCAFPDECAAWVARVPPGAGTAGVLGLVDPVRMSQPGRVDALVGLERLIAWAAAQQVRMLAAMANDPLPDSVAPDLDREWVSEDVRAALGESSLGATVRLRHAQELTGRLDATLSALGQGRISARQADAVVDATRLLEDDAARQVESDVLPDPDVPAGLMPVMAAFRRRLRRAVLVADPRGAEQAHADAVAERRVWARPDGHGISFLGAQLPAEGAAAVLCAVDAKADQEPVTPTDTRTKEQKRADALVQICLNSLHPESPSRVKIEMDTGAVGCGPRYHGLRPAVNVCVALSTLLGADEQPGQLDGYGPIPAALARRLANDPTGTWRRLVTDPTGRLIDYGQRTYRPPAALARHVIARDRTCRAAGCTRPAEKSDLHHVVPFSRGGSTSAANLIALCERHHYAIHDGGWKITRDDTDGTLTWTSPTGHTYRVPPEAYPIDTTRVAVPSEDQNDHAEPTPPPPF
jgi:hypothetical protein